MRDLPRGCLALDRLPGGELRVKAAKPTGDIAYDGSWLGGETFVSFDLQAIDLVKQQGQSARCLELD